MNIAFTGGSTGGHVFPIRSLIQYIQTHPQIKSHFDTTYWFGENDSMEQRVCDELILEYDNIQFATVIAGKVRREHDIKALAKTGRDMVRFLWGMIIMVVRLHHYHIDVVFCKGGFVSLPLTIAAWIYRIPIIVHESDTSAGLATRICGRLATHNFSGFADTLPNTKVVGQIMSSDLIVSGVYHYGESHKTNLLIMGGSLGAKAIYQAIVSLNNQNTTALNHYNIIIILGTMNQDMKGVCEKVGKVIERADQSMMGQLYAWADICVCRGGTTSLAEMELFNIRKIIVPLPITHDQVANAQYYVDHHGDDMILQNNQLNANLGLQLQQYTGYRKPAINISTLRSKLDFAKEKIIEYTWNINNQ